MTRMLPAMTASGYFGSLQSGREVALIAVTCDEKDCACKVAEREFRRGENAKFVGDTFGGQRVGVDQAEEREDGAGQEPGGSVQEAAVKHIGDRRGPDHGN